MSIIYEVLIFVVSGFGCFVVCLNCIVNNFNWSEVVRKFILYGGEEVYGKKVVEVVIKFVKSMWDKFLNVDYFVLF